MERLTGSDRHLMGSWEGIEGSSEYTKYAYLVCFGTSDSAGTLDRY